MKSDLNVLRSILTIVLSLRENVIRNGCCPRFNSCLECNTIVTNSAIVNCVENVVSCHIQE